MRRTNTIGQLNKNKIHTPSPKPFNHMNKKKQKLADMKKKNK